MTTFNSPLGPHHLTTLLMGHTNTVQIYQANMAFPAGEVQDIPVPKTGQLVQDHTQEPGHQVIYLETSHRCPQNLPMPPKR